MEREMKIRGLLMDPTTNSPIVILKDVNSDVMLPIWVGPYEANSIASEIEKVAPQRPMTHDLLRNVIQQFGASIRRVVVTELRDNTFYAVIEIEFAGRAMLIDSRPSDAIALALRADCPIFVREDVVESSRSPELSRMEGEEELDEEEVEWPEELDDVSDYKM
jgi:bifunctional DNase/RNase